MRRARPKYQVFVSSTFTDLEEERREVMWGVLKARHVPAGMEHFSAQNDRGWEVIQRTIDQSDYYVLALAGRYGFVDADLGVSWTEREYEYAHESGVPVLAFIRAEGSITKDKMEPSPAGKDRLNALVERVRLRHLVEEWTTKEDLREKVVVALRKSIEDDEDAGRGRPGWYRGDQIPVSMDAVEEFARISYENASLRARLAESGNAPSPVLELVLDDENSLPVYELSEGERGLWRQPSGEGMFAALARPFGSVSEEEVEEYIDNLNRWYPIEGVVRNTGTGAARDVAVELSIEGVEAVELTLDAPPRGGLAVDGLRFQQWKTNPNEHCYVDRYRARGGRGYVLERIRSVPSGAREAMVVFWVKVSEVPHPTAELAVEFRITNSEGAAVEGRGTLKLRRGPRQVVRLEELDDLSSG